LTIVAVTAVMSFAALTTNLVIDAEGVFDTGLFDLPKHHNERYLRFVAYKAAADSYDGLLFGSSRAGAIPIDDLSRKTGATIADFSVTWGLLDDHLPVLQYVLQEKAAKRRQLREVFLLLDIDRFGEQPRTDAGIQTLMPPDLGTESAAHFWWR